MRKINVQMYQKIKTTCILFESKINVGTLLRSRSTRSGSTLLKILNSSWNKEQAKQKIEVHS